LPGVLNPEPTGFPGSPSISRIRPFDPPLAPGIVLMTFFPFFPEISLLCWVGSSGFVLLLMLARAPPSMAGSGDFLYFFQSDLCRPVWRASSPPDRRRISETFCTGFAWTANPNGRPSLSLGPCLLLAPIFFLSSRIHPLRFVFVCRALFYGRVPPSLSLIDRFFFQPL